MGKQGHHGKTRQNMDRTKPLGMVANYNLSNKVFYELDS